MDLYKIKEYCRPYLDGIHREGLFIHYTIHSESHSMLVWENCKKIAKNQLSKLEYNFLEVSCICHDLGLAKWKQEDIHQFDNPEYCNYVRKNHHIRSEAFISSKYDEMGLNADEANIIGRICFAHSSKVNISDLNDEDFINIDGKNEKIRTKLLAAILRVSDALDIRKDRIPPSGYTIDAPFESKLEYLKHQIIENVEVTGTQIIVEISNSENPIIHDVKEKLIEEYSSTNNVLNEHGLITNIIFNITENNHMDTIVPELDYIPQEIRRILELYVKPVNFDSILEKSEELKLVIITGDASVGKTSTAFFLANLLHQKHGFPIIVNNFKQKISSLTNCIIILDDAFGESKFKDKDYVSPDLISKLKEDNYVIITTRKQVLVDALNETRLGEYDYDRFTVEIGQEGCYDDDFLEEILKKHINYYEKEKKIGDEEVKIALTQKELIIHNLRFPHNIDVFVKEKLKEVKNGKNLEDAIEESKWIKRVAKFWFMSLDDTRKFFVFTVWLFPTYKNIFKYIYIKVIETFRKRKPELETGDLNDLIERTSSYIIEESTDIYSFLGIFDIFNFNSYDDLEQFEEMSGIRFVVTDDNDKLIDFSSSDFHKIDFRHPNYREGITIAIESYFRDFLIDLIPLLLELSTQEGMEIPLISATYRIAQTHPDKVIGLLEKFASDPNPKVNRRSALMLGDIGEKSPDLIIPILEKLSNNKNKNVREGIIISLGNIGVIYPDKVMELLKKLSKDRESDVRLMLIRTLGYIGSNYPNRVIRLLKNLSKDKHPSVKESLVNALSQVGKKDYKSVIPLLKELSNDPNPSIRKYLTKALKEIEINNPNDETVKIIQNLSNDNEWIVREAIVDILGDIGKSEPDMAIQIIEKLSNDINDIVRVYIPSSLRKIGENHPDKVMGLLENLSNDKYFVVRAQVVNALAYIWKDEPNRTRNILENFCVDERWEVREPVAKVLGIIGEEQPDFVKELLEKLSTDNRKCVKVRAKIVMKKNDFL